MGGTFVFFLSNWLVLTLFQSEYQAAAAPLSILAMNIFLVGINILFGNPLTLWDKQKVYTLAVAGGAASNIILNVLLIPKYSYIGAAFATLLSEIVVFLGVVTIFYKTVSKKFIR
jgi:O-antigen/teichoic acid export membrane protein